MTTTRKGWARRLVAGTGALVLGVTGLSAVAMAAPGPDQPEAPDSGSLTIHKRLGAEGSAGNGTVIANPPGTPLAGVEFTVWQLGNMVEDVCVPINLTEADDWAGVPTGTAPATLAEVQEQYCLVDEDGVSQITAEGTGEAQFLNLGLGLYYVQETDAPANIVSRTAPFYVTVPLPNNGDWIYAVHAYPKNQELDEPEKEINPDSEQAANGYVVGSVVQWTITQKVPALNTGEEYTQAVIYDVLPASLEYVETMSVKLGGVDLLPADYTVNDAGVTWTLTEAGLDKLTAGAELEVIFKTKVLEVTDTGEIVNPGSDGETPGYGSTFNGKTTPGGPEPATYWGALEVTKVDNSNPAKPLAGAEFKVFAKVGTECPAEPSGTAVSTGTSGTNGLVTWTPNLPDNGSPLGLFVANSNDGPLTNPSKDYCLYETKVPAGYTGVGVQTVNIKAGLTAKSTVTVTNVQKDGPDLPLTGASGTILMTAGGLALIGLAGGLLVASRRRSHQE